MNKRTFSWMSPRLEERNISKYGKGSKGIFAKKNIKKDEIIAIFGGYVMSVKEEEALPKYMNDYGLQITEEFVLGIKKKNEISSMDYFNHSCDPNAGFRGQIFLVSMRDIKKGEEVMFDYAMVLHKVKNASFYKIKCLCGSKNCRGYITENDWKIPELQKKYDGFFQFFIQEKINKKIKK